MVGQQLLGKRLVPRQQQSPRVASRVALPHELEKRHHVLIVSHDAIEFLEQIENDIGLPIGDGGAQLGQAVEHTDTAHIVTALAERGGHVVLGTPLFDFLVGSSLETLRWHQACVYYDERAQFLVHGKQSPAARDGLAHTGPALFARRAKGVALAPFLMAKSRLRPGVGQRFCPACHRGSWGVSPCA